MSLLLAILISSIALGAAVPGIKIDAPLEHHRMKETQVQGKRYTLPNGTLLVSANKRKIVPLLIQFHGEPWMAEWSAVQRWKPGAALVIQFGTASSPYGAAFQGSAAFEKLIISAEKQAGVHFHPVVVSSFSAGYGAVREILKNKRNWKRIDALLLEDSLHCDYANAKPGALQTDTLRPFLDFAREAIAGRKQMILTHAEVIPGNYASTRETADYMIQQLHLSRHPALVLNPPGMKQTSQASRGRLIILGFAGDSALDHLDHYEALSSWLKRIR